MAPGDGSDDAPPPIRVTDRRRFTESGEERDPAATPAAAPPPSSPREQAPPEAEAEAEATGPAFGMSEMGIQAVFYILWQSAALALGAPDPSGRQLPIDLGEAQQAIDLLRALKEKTRGNLTRDEEDTLQQLLHDAQLRYVEAARAPDGRPS